MQILQAAALYFLVVFGAGFVLGIGRVLMVVPLLGERTAELLEMPLMLLVIVAASRWIVCHRFINGSRSSSLAVGLIAVGMVLVADLAVGMWLRGMSATEVLLDRDPVSGAVYYASLLLFAVMPVIITRLRRI